MATDERVAAALGVLADPDVPVGERIQAAYTLPPELRAGIKDELAALDRLIDDNPLVLFGPHSEPQREFLEARTRIVAAFAGNRFGKTTSLVIKSLAQVCRRDVLPAHVRPFKQKDADLVGRPIAGRIVSPSFSATVEGVILPAFKKWCPASEFRGGTFDKAWDKQLRILRFADGSWIQVMSYDQDPSLFGGTALDFVGYDEPPPRLIREECQMRLVDYGGFEMFALTPLEGAGWMRKAVWRRRDEPDVTVITGSIHDNPTLDEASKNAALEGSESDVRRRAKEFGEFVDFGDNLIYPDFDKSVLKQAPDRKHVASLPDVVCGIDPGMRNAAFVWGAFDSDNVCIVFDEALLQNETPKDYARKIREINEKWGVKPRYVIDPSARNRAAVTGQSVEALLNVEGIYCEHGQNAVEAGLQQVRNRLANQGLLISPECRGLIDEAEDYRTARKEDGELHVVKTHDHRLDALRYLLMSRLWTPLPADPRPKGKPMDQSWMPPFRARQTPAAPTGAFT